MNKVRRYLLGVAFFAAAFALPQQVFCAATDHLDIHVSINGSKSLQVDSTSYSYGALNVNVSSVSGPSPIIVTNNSTVFVETYTITGANAVSRSGGTDWTLATSTDVDTFALSAQFSETLPPNADGSWTDDALTTLPRVCSPTQFGNGNLSESGTAVWPGQTRKLWFRLKTPGSVSDGGMHTITLTLSVL